jgi:hypothetical protein
MRISEQFTRYWISFGLPDVRDIWTTYDGSDYSLLPQLPDVPDDLSWLCELPKKLSDAGMRDGNYFLTPEALSRRATEAQHESPPNVPQSFWTLLKHPHLQARIPSCTASYFDLPKVWTKSPFRDGDMMLRFMNDQQCCYCWYLYVAPDETPFVLASSGAGGEAFLEQVDFVGRPDLLADALKRTYFVSPSFDSFVYRFWIENLIWFKMTESIALAPNELVYVRQIAPDYKPQDKPKA